MHWAGTRQVAWFVCLITQLHPEYFPRPRMIAVSCDRPAPLPHTDTHLAHEGKTPLKKWILEKKYEGVCPVSEILGVRRVFWEEHLAGRGFQHYLLIQSCAEDFCLLHDSLNVQRKRKQMGFQKHSKFSDSGIALFTCFFSPSCI